jgi:hypothetical protein
MAKISYATAKTYLPVLFACHCPPLLKKQQYLVPTVSKKTLIYTLIHRNYWSSQNYLPIFLPGKKGLATQGYSFGKPRKMARDPLSSKVVQNDQIFVL